VIRSGVTEATWTLELGQFDTTVNGWDEPTRIEIEKTLRATPDVLHVRLPGEMLCLGCDQWSQEDPVKVEKQTGRHTWTCPTCVARRRAGL
jgi:hypothetical protein